ncbi:uncharacterized protein LOC133979773 [Scomber scombrus]|nr:uncharacterized protein LOC133979773 [Scomber scombrus]
MDQKDSPVNGSVLIIHQIQDGKHRYEVDNVVKDKKASGGKPFVRKGDKLMQINGKDLQDLTPEELAQTLAEGNPMLTVHKMAKIKEPTNQPDPAEDFLYPVSKETRVLNFNMEMMREEDQESDWSKEGEGREDGGIEDDVCQPEDEQNGQDKHLLVISLTKTSISVVKGRGCDDGSTCHDVVVVAESSTVTLVPRGSFRQDRTQNVMVECLASQQYLRGICSQKTVYVSPNPENITIYYYRSTSRLFTGIPVVLNFTGSNCFLRCCKEGQKVLLQVETCDKKMLRKISKDDKTTLSFVFFMKGPRSELTFESVLHRGWFIQIVNTDEVEMATLDGRKKDQSFLFVIQT